MPGLMAIRRYKRSAHRTIDKKDIVSTLHQAYDGIDVAKEGFGAFIAGPSKTADIEQSLVIGAHGARSATVYIVG